MKTRWIVSLSAMVLAAAAVAIPASADAFCGTYVNSGDAELFNNATQVAMMRKGQQTVLSMQNNYEGPPKEFAMIVPTPVVLQKTDVKTLDDKIFEKLDKLTAPRLVEYWEKDPCEPERAYASPAARGGAGSTQEDTANKETTVEAEFAVGEYDVVVLSSEKSTSLESWLHDNGYNIPKGAAPYLKPYIQQGSKFFVAKVNPNKVKFNSKGEAVLSPIRFHYESKQFKLPIRLGLINSKGKQDLIVNVLAQDQRYRVANYPNAKIPTNIEVVNAVRDKFPQFYRSLFRETVRQNEKNGQKPVVTEYSWNASTCDPCPGPVNGLSGSDLATLGADVINDSSGGEFEPRYRGGWVVTRLHARYGKDEVGKDLVFEKAPAIWGGRERENEDGELIRGSQPAERNNFQGRYIIRHRWDKEVVCDDPEYGRWGGPPGGGEPSTTTSNSPNNGGIAVNAGSDVEEPELSKNVRDDIPELGVEANPNGGADSERACSLYRSGQGSGFPLGILAVVGGLGVLAWRRRR